MSVRNLLTGTIARARDKAREKRRALFHSYISVNEDCVILDLGSGDGSHINSVLEGIPVNPSNVYIADLNNESVDSGAKRYGYKPVYLTEEGELPFSSEYFDVVFCSSVIEHITVPKHKIWETESGLEFYELSRINQNKFADEIRRVGKSYFVQTPNKWFVIESHSQFPFLGYLPRKLLIPVLRIVNKIWIKKTSPDWHLLTRKDMKKLFPEAMIVSENVAWLSKSIIAIKQA